MSSLQGKSVLITGGTGSFGTAMVKKLLSMDEVSKVVVFSRDELKQFEMRGQISSDKLRFFLGDIRDYQRLIRATDGINVVIHAAAMKQIPASEYNPMEAIKTNILGAENVVNVAIENGVERVIALSTDKAANPANLYGATKLCSDKLMVAGNALSGKRKIKFSVVRYGNVLGSRGSVIPFFLEKAKQGRIPITDERMTRFWLTLDDGVQFVLDSLETMHGGEIFVPKIASFKVTDVAEVVCPGIATEIIGIRPGEKLHEVMITEDDSYNTFDFESHYAIVAPNSPTRPFYDANAKKVPEGFRYSSDNNPLWHSSSSFRAVLNENGILS
jgi:UDP-N-acetylglucosamine 4,6-dehydratase